MLDEALVPEQQDQYNEEISKIEKKDTIFSRIGEILYFLGFHAELAFVAIYRFSRSFVIFLLGVLRLLFGGIAKKAKVLAAEAWEDITAPFKRLASGVQNMRRLSAERKQGEQPAEQTVGLYLASGVKTYGHLLANFVRALVPVAALAVFIVILNSVLSMRYALAVSVGGAKIGYVENETVLEDGLNLLRMRINLADEGEASQWEVTPALSVGPTTATLNKTQVADGILASLSDEIQKGYGVYANGQLIAATTAEDAMRAFLEKQKEPYINSALPNAEISFVNQVEVSQQEEIFLTKDIKPVEELKDELMHNVSEEVSHIVAAGDTLDNIALFHNITLEELKTRNPDYAEEAGAYAPPEGSRLLIHRAEPFLQVKTTYRRSAIEPVPYQTVEKETNNRFKGQRMRVQRGADGEEQVWYEVVLIDGEEVEANRIDELTQRLKDPQDEIYEVGTLEGAADGAYSGSVAGSISGSGSYIWPVPGATGSSRGFLASHGGVDINAPTGTPIYASNGGVVLFAGTGGGSYWSYGNYVEIQHPDGIVTRYAHCTQVLVSSGQTIGQGQLIGLVGSTGRSSGPHCHFEVAAGGSRTNPYNFVASPFG